MGDKASGKRNTFGIILRLWFFLILAMLLLVTLFPMRLPLCGAGGNVEGQKLTLRDYVVLLGSNAAIGAALVRIRSRLLFLLASIVALIAADWLFGHLLSTPMRFGR